MFVISQLLSQLLVGQQIIKLYYTENRGGEDRDRDKDRERQTSSPLDRQTDRQTDRERQTSSPLDRQTDGERSSMLHIVI